MPNHFHAILLLAKTEGEAAAVPVTLPSVVQWLKTMTTNADSKGVASASWARFPGRLWQRDYYEHIIRNDRALRAIRH
jgi:putative transposase